MHQIPEHEEPISDGIGTSLDSLLQAYPQERMRVIYRIEDAIRGDYDYVKPLSNKQRVVVTMDQKLVVLAIDTQDRSGLLLDISKCLAVYSWNSTIPKLQ